MGQKEEKNRHVHTYIVHYPKEYRFKTNWFMGPEVNFGESKTWRKLQSDRKKAQNYRKIQETKINRHSLNDFKHFFIVKNVTFFLQKSQRHNIGVTIN